MTGKPAFPARLSTAVAKRPVASLGHPAAPVKMPLSTSTVATGNAPLRAVGSADAWAVAHRRRLVDRLVASEALDERVIAAMSEVPRHLFVDTALAQQAYEDTSLPIGLGQTISKPSVVARMLTLLLTEAGQPLEKVLEIGTGCGYQAALLSRLAVQVHSVERLRGLHEKAKANLRPLLIANLHLMLGDGMLGFEKGAPYDAIISAAGGDDVPACWLEQLAPSGCIIAPTWVGPEGGTVGVQKLVIVKKRPGGVITKILEPVQFVPLKSGLA